MLLGSDDFSEEVQFGKMIYRVEGEFERYEGFGKCEVDPKHSRFVSRQIGDITGITNLSTNEIVAAGSEEWKRVEKAATEKLEKVECAECKGV
jgi:hypothetical protein